MSSNSLRNIEDETAGTDFPGPNDIPPPAEDQLTEEDLFRMRSLTINSKKGLLGGASETAEQSIISLADSASNFDEHVGDDPTEIDYEKGLASQSSIEPESLPVVAGYCFGRPGNPDFVPNGTTVSVLSWPEHLVIPPCPTTIDEEDWVKSFRDAKVYLVGTAHFSKDSHEDVINTIKNVIPDYVMVELCPARISIISMDEQSLLKEAKELNSQKIAQTMKQNGAVQGILHVLLLSMSANVTRQLGMAPGGEFRAAHRTALAQQHCRVVLGDRPIHVTLQRALASLSFWQKIKFFTHVIFSHSETITPEEVERCKRKDMLEQLLAEMADDFPQLSRIFVDERDAYMAHALHALMLRCSVEKRLAWENGNTGEPFEPFNAVAVVGIGHTPGITTRWEAPVDFVPLMDIPPPSLSSKVFSYGMRTVFWGVVGFAIYKGSMRIARRFT